MEGAPAPDRGQLVNVETQGVRAEMIGQGMLRDALAGGGHQQRHRRALARECSAHPVHMDAVRSPGTNRTSMDVRQLHLTWLPSFRGARLIRSNSG